jgi:hypothetical protein
MRNLTRATMILATAVLAGGVGAGCGGDDDDSSSGDVSTGLAESKLLSDVTAAEAQSACENLASGFEASLSEERLVRAFCTLFGAIAADTTAECETQRDTCIDQAANGQGIGAQASGMIEPPDCEGSESLSECQGTVGELETCANDMIDQVTGLLDSFSCADAATIDESSTEGLGDFQQPASCTALECGEDGPFGGGD